MSSQMEDLVILWQDLDIESEGTVPFLLISNAALLCYDMSWLAALLKVSSVLSMAVNTRKTTIPPHLSSYCGLAYRASCVQM